MSNVPGHVLISYDLNGGHFQVRRNMMNRGYATAIKLGDNNHTLPNTTLYKYNTSTDQALLDLRTACFEEGVALQHVVAVIGSQWVAAG